MDIILYDPIGKTAQLLSDLSMPIPKTTNFNVISSQRHDIVLMGRQIHLNEKMTSKLLKVAAGGAKNDPAKNHFTCENRHTREKQPKPLGMVRNPYPGL